MQLLHFSAVHAIEIENEKSNSITGKCTSLSFSACNTIAIVMLKVRNSKQRDTHLFLMQNKQRQGAFTSEKNTKTREFRRKKIKLKNMLIIDLCLLSCKIM